MCIWPGSGLGSCHQGHKRLHTVLWKPFEVQCQDETGQGRGRHSGAVRIDNNSGSIANSLNSDDLRFYVGVADVK